ncbi:MAG: hypothetical protein KIT52_09935 [Anaerolineae bacterium]|jgi:hypothetical protein|nr:hypothetical protein [Anaerolineae bacterium]
MAERPASSPGDFHSSASQTDARPRAEAVLGLERLLDILFPGPPSLDCVTIDDIERRYPLTGLGAPALTAIEQSQRIVRARGDFSQTGLGEFHIGLIYFQWADHRAAANQFALARQSWTLAGDHSANCLTHFAQGLALYNAYHHEPAMLQFGRAERLLNRPVHGAGAARHAALADKLRPLLTAAQVALREDLWPKDEPPPAKGKGHASGRDASGAATGATAADGGNADGGGMGAQTPAPPLIQLEAQRVFERGPRPSEWAPRPLSNLHRRRADGSSGPVPGHVSVDERFGWYIIAERRGSFLPTIAPGTWLLADSEIDERPPAARDYVVVGSSRAGLGSITANPISYSTALPYCYLGYRVFGPDGAAQLILDDSRQTASGGDLLVLAVVEGFWLALDGQPAAGQFAAGTASGGING